MTVSYIQKNTYPVYPLNIVDAFLHNLNYVVILNKDSH
jgi:hypothetical protein